MKMQTRRKKIVETVNREGNVSFRTLMSYFKPISEMTLRRDLDYLDKQGLIIRVHGGARSVDVVIGTDDLFNKRVVRSIEAKEIIAKKALDLLRVNTAIFIDSGTTTSLFARSLPDNPYMIFTSGLTCAQEMFYLNKIQLHIVGGRVNHASQSVCSAKSIDFLKNVNFQTVFLGVTGFSAEHGFTCGTEDECELKKAVIRNADVVVALMDTSKIDIVSTFTYAMPNEVDIVVCEKELDEDTNRIFKEAGVTVL